MADFASHAPRPSGRAIPEVLRSIAGTPAPRAWDPRRAFARGLVGAGGSAAARYAVLTHTPKPSG
jgi:hypothetical protein